MILALPTYKTQKDEETYNALNQIIPYRDRDRSGGGESNH